METANQSNPATETSATERSINPILIETMYVPKEEFMTLLQDRGIPDVDPLTNQPHEKKPHKLFRDGDRLYRDLYKLGNESFNRLNTRTDLFAKLAHVNGKSKNVMRHRNMISKWALDNRELAGKADVTTITYPDWVEFARNQPDSVSEIFVLDQKRLILLAMGEWGQKDEEDLSTLITLR